MWTKVTELFGGGEIVEYATEEEVEYFQLKQEVDYLHACEYNAKISRMYEPEDLTDDMFIQASIPAHWVELMFNPPTFEQAQERMHLGRF